MRKKFKGDEKALAEMLFKIVFQANGTSFPEDTNITRGEETICAWYQNGGETEQCFIDLKAKKIFKSKYQKIDLFAEGGTSRVDSPVMNTPIEEESPVMNTPVEEESPVTNTPIEEESPVTNTPIEEESPVELTSAQTGSQTEVPAEVIHAEESTLLPPPPDFDIDFEDQKSAAEAAFPKAMQEIETRVSLLRKVNAYNEEKSDLYLNPDGTMCYPSNIDSDCVGRFFGELSEDDRDELMDLLYSNLRNVEVYDPSNVLVVHL